MQKFQTLIAALIVGVAGLLPAAQAQDKGTIGISMPTKSSARWISDGASMVKYFQASPTFNTPTTTSPTSWPRSRT